MTNRPLRNLLAIIGLALAGGLTLPATAAECPNFILVIADDVSVADIGCYGHPSLRTPNLDRLAADGVRFTNAYLTCSSCSPTRTSLITGRYPHNTGSCELHSQLPAGHFLWPEALKDAGYYTVLSGKHHMGPNANPGFTKISKGKGPGKEEDWVPLLRDRPADQPFLAWFASTDAHRDWQFDENAPVYDPSTVVVPPYMVDDAATRKDLADYYHEVSRIDHYVGAVRAELKRQAIERDTVFIFMADNGRPFPRDKTRLYDSGIKTPLLIARPGTFAPGVCDALVSATIDLGPAILEMAALDISPALQGVSLLPLLNDSAATTRDFVFAEQNWHVFQAHQRVVRNGQWVYIRNAWPHLQAMCMEADRSFPAGNALWDAEAAGKLKPEQRDIFRKPRPAEELYNVDNDPNQFQNLADDPAHAETRANLRGVLDRWTAETGDTVPDNPTPNRQAVNSKDRFPGFEYREMPGDAKQSTKINAKGPVTQATP